MRLKYAITSRMKYFSTKQVARMVAINVATLERWLTGGRLRPPRIAQIGRGRFRYWTDADVKRVREYKRQNYRKGRGRKKGSLAKVLHKT
jgi:hypothetical protein